MHFLRGSLRNLLRRLLREFLRRLLRVYFLALSKHTFRGGFKRISLTLKVA